MANGHFTGRLDTAITETIAKATGRDGKFYSILNNHGFFDVSDQSNGLTTEQRARVPAINQTRMSDLCTSIAEMIKYVLSDPEHGVITKHLQAIIDTLDTRGAANSAQLNSIGTSMDAAASSGVLGPLGAVSTSMKASESLTANMMGICPYSLDMIPPLAIGIPALPFDIANLYPSGWFHPNWDFLYSYEPIKKNRFFFDLEGKCRIGANIEISRNARNTESFLKDIFSVITQNKDTFLPSGDLIGGVTGEQFDIIIKASTMTKAQIENNIKFSSFSLNEFQMRASYSRYVEKTLWSVIKNKDNSSYLHWGALANNACPEYVKTALCSYLKDTGTFALTGNSESAFLSYCVTMGVYYRIGYKYKVSLYGIAGLDRIISTSGTPQDITSNANIIASNGLAMSQSIGDSYFIFIADILSRLTKSSQVSDDTDIKSRKRRIAEANLIYKGLGKPTIEYGKSPSTQDEYHQEKALRARKFDILMTATIDRYED